MALMRLLILAMSRSGPERLEDLLPVEEGVVLDLLLDDNVLKAPCRKGRDLEVVVPVWVFID